MEERTQPALTMWVDADAAPRDVKDIVYRTAKRLGIPTVLVANRRLSLPLDNPFVRAVWVKGGADEADRHIVEHAVRGDLAITADIPLAALLVEKGVRVVDPRGDEYTAENVQERLSIRDFMESLRGAGVESAGAKPYGARDRQAFAAALDRSLSASRKGAPEMPERRIDS